MFERPTTQSLLSRTFTVFGSSFLPFVSLALIVRSPTLIFNHPGTFTEMRLGLPSVGLIAMGSSLIETGLSMVVSATLVYGVIQGLRGQSISLGECFGFALSRWLPILALAFKTGLVISVGTLGMNIPGFIVACGFYVAAPVLMVEGREVTASIHRSWDLTEGYKRNIFLVALCLLFIQGIINYILGMALAQVTVPFVGSMVVFFSTGFSAALNAVASGVVYYDLRGFREGLGEDELAAVFD